jgi:hypothetical protein
MALQTALRRGRPSASGPSVRLTLGAQARPPEGGAAERELGGAIDVNAAPMVQAGRGKMAGVVIGEGVSAPNAPTDADFSQATAPTQRLTGLATTCQNVAPSAIVVFRGNGDLIGDWLGLIARARALAGEVGATPILFNLSGGRRPMTRGGRLGAAGGAIRPCPSSRSA